MAYQAIPPAGGGSGDTWYDQQVTAARSLSPTLTRYEYIKIPAVANAAPGVVVSVAGGAQGVADDLTYLRFTTGVWPAPRTTPIAVIFRCKFPAIAASKASFVGFADTSNTACLVVGWSQTTSATKWVLYDGAFSASTVNADTSWHNVMLVSDATTITAVIDGVTVKTSTAVSTLPNVVACTASFASATLTPGVLVSRIVYGYVDP